MLSSRIKEKIRLSVTTKDETADIYVIDSNFRVARRGRGTSAAFDLKPGIYTVKIRVGFESQEKDVVLTDHPETVEFGWVQFPSAIPLADTGRTHEYQMGAAQKQSRIVHQRRGQGSWIFIFARDWKPQNPEQQFETTSLPQKGLKLKDAAGQTLVNLEGEAVFDNSQDAWAACNIEVDPGQYLLSVKTESGARIEQTVAACSGWQTQVFLLQRTYSHEKTADARRADMTNSGILMARTRVDSGNPRKLTGGFDPTDQKMRLLDLARLGLANGRQILPDHVVDRILYGKFENPMLGILGGYLLLKSRKTRLRELQTVVTNLRRILGRGRHPDVEALALRVEKGTSNYRFDLPPMLRQSWMYLVDSTVRDWNLIPLHSFAGRNADRVLNDEPWLLFATNDGQAADQAITASVKYLVSRQLSGGEGYTVAQPEEIRRRDPEFEFPDERQPSSGSQSDPSLPATDSLRSLEDNSKSYLNEVDDKTVNTLVKQMGLPKANVVEALNKLKSKDWSP